jgi:hypothetical protein
VFGAPGPTRWTTVPCPSNPAGSDAGGETAAILTSLGATCKRHGLDPWSYLADVLARIPAHPTEHIAELLPDAWALAQRATS